jgi:hypothetical protein
MKRYALIFVALLAISGMAIAQETEKKDAETAAQSWLGLLVKSDYGASWDTAASVFKSAVTKPQWQQAASSARDPLGKVVSRKLKAAEYTTSLPGAPDGKYVVIQYESSFENKKSGIETVTPMLDKDGQWHVSGYFIK